MGVSAGAGWSPESASGWSLPAADLDAVLAQTEALWRELRGASVLMTGASGFIGAWLVESLLWADARLDLGLDLTLVARNVQRLQASRPQWNGHQRLRWHAADIVAGDLPGGRYDLIVHGAAETNVRLDNPSPASIFTTTVTGTQRMLELAARSGKPHFMLLSSGAVYGRQPPELERMPETYPGAPDCAAIHHAYGHAKRAAELLVNIASAQGALHGTSARCFAFSGAYLPLDSGFAAGNFLADALAARPITILGDGTPLRSYLYGLDMAVWLWQILLRGHGGMAYNVGSDVPVSIAELAQRIQAVAGDAQRSPVRVMTPRTPGKPAERYVPDTRRAREELGLALTVDLDEGLRRMAAWHRRGAA